LQRSKKKWYSKQQQQTRQQRRLFEEASLEWENWQRAALKRGEMMR